jgi:hypothetical protein
MALVCRTAGAARQLDRLCRVGSVVVFFGHRVVGLSGPIVFCECHLADLMYFTHWERNRFLANSFRGCRGKIEAGRGLGSTRRVCAGGERPDSARFSLARAVFAEYLPQMRLKSPPTEAP